MMLNPATKKYIEQSAGRDISWLALHPSKDRDVDMMMALQQIEGRQKAKSKLPAFYANPDIIYPKRISMEQCSSEKTAKYKASLVNGRSFADLSGGFGVDTVFFSRKFMTGIFVEPQKELCDIFEYNAKLLNISNVRIVYSNLENFLPLMDHVDVIYIDPSRRDKSGSRVVELAELSPNVLAFKNLLLQKCDILMVKLSPMLDISSLVRDLPEIIALHIVAVDNECKEMLCILDASSQSADIQIRAINIKDEIEEIFTHSLNSERGSSPRICAEIGKYLYEPNAAIMKSGLYNAMCQRFDLDKIALNSNLFTSDFLLDNFPGRRFVVESVFNYQPKKIRKQLEKITSASIAVRNFPLSPEELRNNLKIKDGNGKYIFATTLSGGEKVLIVCDKA